MTTKMKIQIGVIAGAALLGLGLYNRFSAVHVPPNGVACTDDVWCDGQCLALGGIGKYETGKVCTKECSADGDCAKPAKCEEIELTVVDPTKGAQSVQQQKKKYCLR